MSRFNVELVMRDRNFGETLRRVRGELDQTTLSTIALQSGMNALRIGSMISIGALAAMVAPTILATKALEEYDTTLRRAIALGGDDFAGKLDELSGKISDVALTWGVLAEDVATGVVEFTKAGFGYDEVVMMMEGTAQLALMNQETFETSAETVTYAYQLWGEEVGSVSEMMESMHVAANMTVMDIGDLGTAFEYAGSSFNIAGISFDEFLAAFGALSQVAYSSGQTVGTLINRILLRGDELEDFFGLAPGTILSDGRVNISALIDVLANLEDQSAATAKVAEMFGVRSVAAFNALMKSSGFYQEVLGELDKNTNTLYEDSLEMTHSLGSLMGQLREAFYAPFRDADVLEGLSAAIGILKTSITEGGLGEALVTLLKVSIMFVTDSGPKLILIATDMMTLMTKFAPMLENIASLFVNVLGVISKIPAPIMLMVAAFGLMTKIIPIRELTAFAMAIQQHIHKTAILSTTTNTATASVAANTAATVTNTGAINGLSMANTTYMTRAFNAQASAMGVTGAFRNQTAAAAGTSASITTLGTSNLGLTEKSLLARAASIKQSESMVAQTGVAGAASGGLNTLGNSNVALSEKSLMAQLSTAKQSETMVAQTGAAGAASSSLNGLGASNTILTEKALLSQAATAKQSGAMVTQTGVAGAASTSVNTLGNSNVILTEKTLMSQMASEGQTGAMVVQSGAAKGTSASIIALGGSNTILTEQSLLAQGAAIRHSGAMTTEGASATMAAGGVVSLTGATAQNGIVTTANIPILGRFALALGMTKNQAVAAQLSIKGLIGPILGTGMAAQMASTVGIFAFTSGLMSLVMGKSIIVKALGAISMAFALLAFMAWQVAGAMTVMTGGFLAISAGAALLSFYLMMDEQQKALDDTMAEYENKYGSAKGGRVMSTGWRYIHEGEDIIPADKTGFASVNSTAVPAAADMTTNNYDNRTINVYDVKQSELDRYLRARGR